MEFQRRKKRGGKRNKKKKEKEENHPGMRDTHYDNILEHRRQIKVPSG
jgi:hypothetical protein